MKTINKGILTLALCGLTVAVSAQSTGSNTPYSRYGYGLLNDRAQGFNKGMSGLAYGMRNARQLNTQNPASVAVIDSLTFLYDLGVTLQNGKLSEGENSTNVRNSSLDYLTAGFRLSKGLGIYLGLRPFSTVGYQLSSTQSLTDPNGTGTQTLTQTLTGEGGFHEVGFGLGWMPLKNFSVGVEAMYFWGNYKHSAASAYSNLAINPIDRYYEASLSSYRLTVGAQYEMKLNAKQAIGLGAVYRLGHNINNEAKTYIQRKSSGTVVSADTVTADKAFALPHSLGVGLVWKYKNNWRVGVDYTKELWGGLRYPELLSSGVYAVTTDYFKDRDIVTVGADYYPNQEGLRYRDHIQYRVGVSYASPYFKVNGSDGPKSYTVSAGVGLPVSNRYNQHNVLNVSLQWEHVKPSVVGMIKENYLRLSIGLTFNERWFMKWKVD